MNKTILDMCCGSRMFWFDRADPRAVFVDIRAESHILCDGRKLEIAPDLIADFRQLPFADNTFQIVVFDPPHLTHCGPEGWQGKKYGILSKSWKDDLTKGFAEAFRVLRAGGVLIFKWNEVHIPTRDIIKRSPVPPIFGHPSGKRANTNWVCFQKPGENLIAQLEAAQKLNPLSVNVSELEATYIGDIRLHMAAISDWKSRAEKAEAKLSAANEKLAWIKCSDGLPEANTPVQVSNGVWVGQGEYDDAEHLQEDERWQDEHHEFINLLSAYPVTHWKPLPPLPQPAGFTVEGE
ncbi:DUF551 domain-containing protein [Yersinia enterocolitica]|nr:DUF551 domain-containing protein [Yersinia enterocolitica]